MGKSNVSFSLEKGNNAGTRYLPAAWPAGVYEAWLEINVFLLMVGSCL